MGETPELDLHLKKQSMQKHFMALKNAPNVKNDCEILLIVILDPFYWPVHHKRRTIMLARCTIGAYRHK